jgi:hypothetical protein
MKLGFPQEKASCGLFHLFETFSMKQNGSNLLEENQPRRMKNNERTFSRQGHFRINVAREYNYASNNA